MESIIEANSIFDDFHPLLKFNQSSSKRTSLIIYSSNKNCKEKFREKPVSVE